MSPAYKNKTIFNLICLDKEMCSLIGINKEEKKTRCLIKLNKEKNNKKKIKNK